MSVDLRVQCTLVIQGHKITLHALLHSGATSSIVDETLLLSILPLEIIKHTNKPMINTQFDGIQLAYHHYVKNTQLKLCTNYGTYNPSITLPYMG